jgi:hypothetical protein
MDDFLLMVRRFLIKHGGCFLASLLSSCF